MKKYILLVIPMLFVFSLFSFGAKPKKEGAEIFMDIDYEGVKCLYNQPGGHVIKKLKHNLEEEDFITFVVINRNDSMFKVQVNSSIIGFIAKGWIKKDRYLGVYSRAYDRKMNIYVKPNKSSRILYQEEYNPRMYNVIDSHGTWLKIRIVLKNKVIEGWISSDMQCANVYSTCS